MGLIQFPRPWDRQPDIVVEPVKTGPYAGAALLWNAATPQINLANGATPSGAGTGVSERGGPYGKEADFSGSGTGRFIFPTAAEQDSVTFAIEARIDSVADLDRLVSGYNGASSGKYDVYYESAAGRWTLQVLRATTNAIFRFDSGLGTTFSGALVFTYTAGSAPVAFFNGESVGMVTTNAGSGALVASSNLLGIGGRPDVTTRQPDGGISTVWRLDRAIPADLARSLSSPGAIPALLFEPRLIRVPVSVGGGVTGTLATTNANDTSAASGTTTVTGTLARTNADDTSSASGTTTVVGTLATTNADDTSSASGSVGSDVSGTVAYTNANDTSAASGTTTVTGTLAKTNADDSVSAAGWAGTITGTVDATNGNDASSASGSVGAATTQQGGGRSKRRRQPVVVEIDGEDFIVESEEEAQALLDKAKETAEENAKLAIERASKAKKRSPGKILRDARRQLDVPTIKAPGYEDIAREVQAQIRDTYASTIRTIEIQALLNRAQQQEEDDEDILMLIA